MSLLCVYLYKLVYMTIKFLLKQKNNPSAIYIRLSSGRKIQCICSTKIYINPKTWSTNTNKILPKYDSGKISNKTLSDLSTFISKEYFTDFKNGVIINTIWLRGVINKYHNQIPIGSEDWKIFFEDFIKRHKPNGNKAILKRLMDFQGVSKVLIKNVDKRFANDYSKFMLKRNFLPYTINQELYYFKSILEQAKDFDIEVKDDKWKRLKVKRPKPITLNQKEIDLIYNHDFRDIPKYYNLQTLVILGIYTGVRLSDLHQISMGNIVDGFLRIKTKKTNTNITLPVHPRVYKMLEREFHIVDRGQFGVLLKEVGKIVGLNRKAHGRKYGGANKKGDPRKQTEEGTFPLNQLLSSHVMRRTFATQSYGKIPTQLLRLLTGHSTEQMLLKYIGVSEQDAAKALLKVWQNE